MKKTVIALLLTYNLITISFAQKAIKQGVVSFTCTEVVGGGMQGSAMKGATQLYFFTKKYNKVEAKMMGGMVHTQAIKNLKKNESFLITDGVMGKNLVAINNNDKPSRKYKIKEDSETKQILGYDCKKQTLTDDEGENITLFITDKIMPKESPFSKQYPDLKGFPLYFEVSKQGLIMKFEAKEVSEKIPKDAFKLPTKGYEKMTMEQFNKSVSKMGGE